ncbi:DnaJ-domain-containing protein [Morchella conica CCBAS932]|uniref:DnaJ-domain-containing protein n=1 Tax=Morchella conica CCBAS932 TaxID=1392247 RepID=A0A3N4KL25_9PEZI|nr:DnaJ-domain-containing protein [Morchella conica CCBAS932]
MVEETSYYELLGVDENATALEIKKAYRKQAIIHHPDKNLDDPDAPIRFQEIGEAYQVLSDPALRKKYDTLGKEHAKPEAGFDDALELFNKIFGGDAFQDWVGEISLFKDIIAIMEIKNRESDPEEPESPSQSSTSRPPQFMVTDQSQEFPEEARAARRARRRSGGSKAVPPMSREARAEARKKAELAKYEQERQRAREERVETLSNNLIRKLSTLTDTKMKASDIRRFQRSIQGEAESLKLESFGLHILHTLGDIYLSRSHAFLDNSIPVVGSIGFCAMFNYVIEKTTDITETWGTLSCAMGAQTAVKQMHKAEEMGGDEWTVERKAEIEQLTTGKILLACWRSTKLELRKIIRDVCDRVLNGDEEYDLQKRRAEALIVVGEVFNSTYRDSTDDPSDNIYETLLYGASER